MNGTTTSMTLLDGPRPLHPGRYGRSLLVAAALTLLGATACGPSSTTGSPLPGAELISLDDGRSLSTTSLTAADQPVVLNVWASWCVPCIEEMPDFERVHTEIGDRITIVGVTDDREAPARRMAEQTGVTYPLYRDPDRSLLPDLGIIGLPATIFIDADGTIVERHQGAMDAKELRATIDRLWAPE